MKCMRRTNTFQVDEDPFNQDAQGIAFKMHEALFFLELLRNKATS